MSKKLDNELPTVPADTDLIKNFHLPAYNEIPDVGLYLNQVVKLINNALQSTFQLTVTETMLSNYVKKHIISSPIKKQYDREQIASLIFIVLAKTVLSLDNIQKLLQLQSRDYAPAIAYEYFRAEFENVVQYVYGLKDHMDYIGTSTNQEKELLRSLIITAAHKFYLDNSFSKIEFWDAASESGNVISKSENVISISENVTSKSENVTSISENVVSGKEEAEKS